MQPLTAMAMGALALGVAAFAWDSATAQTPDACPTQEVSLYFEKGQTEFNGFSKAVVERVAAEARACGAQQLVAETKVRGARAEAIVDAFASQGVQVVLAGQPRTAPQAGDFIADRAASVRFTLSGDVG